MRVLQYYRFPVGTKIPFDKWPSIIEEFLSRQNLTHRLFHYCFEVYDLSDTSRSIIDGTKCKTCDAPESDCDRCSMSVNAALRRASGCKRAVKENPFLGDIKIRREKYNSFQSLNNFTEGSNCTKEDIYSIISKIYRRYGFADTSLIYRDIDFFGRRISTLAPKFDNLMNGYEGSGITLYRSCLSNDNAIILTVESIYPGDVPDATPYANALGELLPGIKCISSTKIIMDEAEQMRYDKIICQAKPFVVQAENYFISRLSNGAENSAPDSPARVASCLKKLAKRYGYNYLGYRYYVYFLNKKLPNGHYICLEFLSGPSTPTADPFVKLCGLGFYHNIWCDDFCPRNEQEASEYFVQLFDTLTEAEQTVFSSILEPYSPTPDWFMPAQ